MCLYMHKPTNEDVHDIYMALCSQIVKAVCELMSCSGRGLPLHTPLSQEPCVMPPWEHLQFHEMLEFGVRQHVRLMTFRVRAVFMEFSGGVCGARSPVSHGGAICSTGYDLVQDVVSANRNRIWVVSTPQVRVGS